MAEQVANDNGRQGVQDALQYLKTGGLGEVIGLTDLAMQMREPKVQMDSDMAYALCLLAGEALALLPHYANRQKADPPTA